MSRLRETVPGPKILASPPMIDTSSTFIFPHDKVTHQQRSEFGPLIFMRSYTFGTIE